MSLMTVNRICAFALMGLFAFLGSGTIARAQSSDQLIAKAYKSVRSKRPSAQNDLAVLITTLRKSQTMPEQTELIEALRNIGDAHGSSPQAIKDYLKEVVPLALLDILRSRADGRVRGQAMMSLRSFEPSDDVLDEAIAVARSDTSADRDFVHQQAELMSQWKKDRQPAAADAGKSGPADPAAQSKAVASLRKRKLDVSYHALLSAVAKANPQVIETLAEAGLQFGGVHLPAAYQAVAEGLDFACRDKRVTPDRIVGLLKVLLKHGYRMDASDQHGNELVMTTIQSCPAPVIASFVDLGARPNPVNNQNATPLTLAFAGGQWDIARALIDRGAGMNKEEIDRTFMELPQDPAQKDLVERAMKNAGK